MNDGISSPGVVIRREQPQSPWLVPLALVPGLAFMVVFVLRSAYFSGQWRWTLFDDALISFAYGRTLAETGEWVWFPGADRVQGITNPLWSALMAVPHVLTSTPSGAIALMTVLTIALMLSLAIITHQTLIGVGMGSVPALVAMGAIPFLYPLTFWTLRGMEVGLIALFSVVMLLALTKAHSPATRSRGIWFMVAGAAGMGAVLTRLDAIVITAAVAGVGLLMGDRKARLAWAYVLGAFIGTAIFVLTFQYFYWGDYLPNTYRLKVDGIPLTDRLARGVFATARALPLLVLVGLAFHHVTRQSVSPAVRGVVSAASAITAVVILYSIWTGGDAWEWSLMLNRTVSVALPAALIAWIVSYASTPRISRVPLLAIALSGAGLGATVNPLGVDLRLAAIGTAISGTAALLVWLGSWFRTRFLVSSLLLTVGFIVATCSPGALLWVPYGGLNVHEDQRFAFRAEELARVTDEQARIAVMWAGAPGYFTERPVIDMFGKSDRVVAQLPPSINPLTGSPYDFVPGHNKWDYDYSVRELRPDVVFQLGDDRDVAESAVINWGYERRCLADGWVSYFRIDSPHVKWDRLDLC